MQHAGSNEMAPVGDVTLRERMDRRAREDRAHPFLIFENRTYTCGEINDAVNRLARVTTGLELLVSYISRSDPISPRALAMRQQQP